MFLVLTGTLICSTELWSFIRLATGGPIREHAFGSFPLWLRIAGSLLPLLGVWKGENARMRFGMGLLAVVAMVELNLQMWGAAVWIRSVSLLGSAVMAYLGWTGTPPPRRLAEARDLVPWVAAFVLFLVVVKVASRLATDW